MKDTVVLITTSFPYEAVTEASFIMPEIEALCKEFRRVIILPHIAEGKPASINPKCEIYLDLTKFPSLGEKISTFLSPRAWRTAMSDLTLDRRISTIKRSFSFTCFVNHYKKIYEDFINEKNIDLEKTLFYTFWFEFDATSLSLIKGTEIITRAHRHDVFEEGDYHFSHTWREQTLKKIKKCFVVSEIVANYIRSKYPKVSDKISVSYLGSTPNQGLNPSKAIDSKLYLLTCARVAPEKDPLRLYSFVREFALNYPSISIEYTWIGDGPLMGIFERSISSAPTNLSIRILGEMTNEGVHNFLSTRHQDIFLLLSHSEGMPISICEAMSYGIPVISSNVGGISEQLDNTGIVLCSQPCYKDFENGMLEVMSRQSEFRIAIRERWENYFNAYQLRESFAKLIQRIK